MCCRRRGVKLGSGRESTQSSRMDKKTWNEKKKDNKTDWLAKDDLRSSALAATALAAADASSAAEVRAVRARALGTRAVPAVAARHLAGLEAPLAITEGVAELRLHTGDDAVGPCLVVESRVRVVVEGVVPVPVVVVKGVVPVVWVIRRPVVGPSATPQ